MSPQELAAELRKDRERMEAMGEEILTIHMEICNIENLLYGPINKRPAQKKCDKLQAELTELYEKKIALGKSRDQLKDSINKRRFFGNVNTYIKGTI
jgi:hypothetical protein